MLRSGRSGFNADPAHRLDAPRCVPEKPPPHGPLTPEPMNDPGGPKPKLSALERMFELPCGAARQDSGVRMRLWIDRRRRRHAPEAHGARAGAEPALVEQRQVVE